MKHFLEKITFQFGHPRNSNEAKTRVDKSQRGYPRGYVEGNCELRSQKTARLLEQMMCKDKHSRIFLKNQMEIMCLVSIK